MALAVAACANCSLTSPFGFGIAFRVTLQQTDRKSPHAPRRTLQVWDFIWVPCPAVHWGTPSAP